MINPLALNTDVHGINPADLIGMDFHTMTVPAWGTFPEVEVHAYDPVDWVTGQLQVRKASESAGQADYSGFTPDEQRIETAQAGGIAGQIAAASQSGPADAFAHIRGGLLVIILAMLAAMGVILWKRRRG